MQRRGCLSSGGARTLRRTDALAMGGAPRGQSRVASALACCLAGFEGWLVFVFVFVLGDVPGGNKQCLVLVIKH